ncbi:hypothetical protein ACFLU5_02860 [Bacteroidota bacterium]
MKRFLLIFIFTGAIFPNAFSQRQTQSIGLRIGDPFGFTYKVYMRNHSAIEWNAGIAFNNWNSRYYRKSFERDNPGLYYYGHNVDFAWALQGRFLKHYRFPDEADVRGLTWFWGFGGQYRMATIEYIYQTQLGVGEIFKRNEINYDLGLEILAGSEYEIPEVPLIAFLELGLFGEIVDDPVKVRFQTAIGIRYIFK